MYLKSFLLDLDAVLITDVPKLCYFGLFSRSAVLITNVPEIIYFDLGAVLITHVCHVPEIISFGSWCSADHSCMSCA